MDPARKCELIKLVDEAHFDKISEPYVKSEPQTLHPQPYTKVYYQSFHVYIGLSIHLYMYIYMSLL